MSNSLIGHRVRVSIVDPWDFVTENGESRTGTIVGEEAGTEGVRPMLQIDLDGAVKAAGLAAGTVFAAFRHAGNTRQDLLDGRLVPSNFAVNTGADGQLSRGPLAFIGSLQVLS
jgi:hypothetical protein